MRALGVPLAAEQVFTRGLLPLRPMLPLTHHISRFVTFFGSTTSKPFIDGVMVI